MEEQSCPKCGNPHMLSGVDADLRGSPEIWWCLNCGLDGRTPDELEAKAAAVAKRMARDTAAVHPARQATGE